MFMLNSPQELKAYVQQEEKNASEKGIKWKIEGDYLYFVPVIYCEVNITPYRFKKIQIN
jgi:hypothetical protein